MFLEYPTSTATSGPRIQHSLLLRECPSFLQSMWLSPMSPAQPGLLLPPSAKMFSHLPTPGPDVCTAPTCSTVLHVTSQQPTCEMFIWSLIESRLPPLEYKRHGGKGFHPLCPSGAVQHQAHRSSQSIFAECKGGWIWGKCPDSARLLLHTIFIQLERRWVRWVRRQP